MHFEFPIFLPAACYQMSLLLEVAFQSPLDGLKTIDFFSLRFVAFFTMGFDFPAIILFFPSRNSGQIHFKNASV